MIELMSRDQLTSEKMTLLMQRICAHLGIAFSANRVLPSLADLNQFQQEIHFVDELNAIGKQFGIRFREMEGSLRDLLNTVNDSGPVLVQHIPDQETDFEKSLLVLSVLKRGRLLVNENGEDSRKSAAWLKKNFASREAKTFRWLLIQPQLAAEKASRFQYQGGSLAEPLTPFRRFVALLKPEASAFYRHTPVNFKSKAPKLS